MTDALKERLYDRIEKQDAEIERLRAQNDALAETNRQMLAGKNDALATDALKYRDAAQSLAAVMRRIVNSPGLDRAEVQGGLLNAIQRIADPLGL